MPVNRQIIASLMFAALLTAQQRPPQTRKPATPTTKPAQKPATKPATKPAEQKPAEPTLVERAQKALDANDYPQAVALLREHLTGEKGDAGDTAAWFNLAFALTALGDKAPAEDAYNKALALDAKLFPAHLNLAILLAAQDRPKDALPHLAAAVELKPDHPRATFLYAETLARTGDAAKAREFYNKALTLDPNNAPALTGSGRLAIEEKNYPLAEKQLARAAELNPKDRNARLELARAHELAEHKDRAAAVYRAFLQDEPTFAPARRRLGQLLMEDHKLDEAIAEFEAAFKLEPTTEDDWNLARAYSAAKKPDPALSHLMRLRENNPPNYEILLLIGQMLNLKREFQAAQGALQQAVRLQPKIPDAYVELANAMYLQDRYPETVAVIEQMKRAAEKVTETPWSTFLMAISLDKLGQAEGAIVNYRRFLAIAGGKFDIQEFQARQRIKALTIVLEKKGKKVP